VAYSWYEPKPFWYLYFSGVENLVTGMMIRYERYVILVTKGFVEVTLRGFKWLPTGVESFEMFGIKS